MIYYMCKNDFLNYPAYRKKSFPVFAGELFTEKEVVKYDLPLQSNKFIKVKANETDTYFVFGCRRFLKGSRFEVLGEN